MISPLPWIADNGAIYDAAWRGAGDDSIGEMASWDDAEWVVRVCNMYTAMRRVVAAARPFCDEYGSGELREAFAALDALPPGP